MVKLEDLKLLLQKVAADKARVVHLHNLGLNHDVVRTYYVLRGPSSRDVYDTMRSIDSIAWLHGGDLIGEFRSEEIQCDKTCPVVDVIWKYKTWNTKWDKQDDDSFITKGTLIYRDTLYDDTVKVPVSMSYVLDGDVWETKFFYDGEQFKLLKFKSTSERYAKNKMLEVSLHTFPLEFYRKEGFKELYGEGISNALERDKLLLDD